ncbi:outer membrane protein assembly factor BamD [Chitinophaga arvensicola]|uniref:Beta-barrel assembly machine subunit BamD n=1 Tax=Chitinophaga arvensicola TaxID=29529 RepID=A0A1I0QS27_9BACT|nr:outer membrane protein assembly factor BamD [Chitinophaga arvensicola]SEW29693.1 Beta-barrel assembly machine subunit BamD [Chitinophaga arvensicola]
MRKFLLYISVLAVIVTTSCNNQLRRIEKSNNFEKKLDYANQLFQKKKYNTAITLYTDLVQVYKGTDKFEPMYYNFAYCSYYVKDYVQAAFQFKNYLDLFPNSPRAVEIDYMQAYCYYKQSPKVSLDQTNTMKAIAAMQTFINNYPTAEKVSEANLVIELCRRKLEKKEFSSAELYYNLGFFKAAGIAFKNLMRNYPDSDKSDGYKVMAIRSYYNYAKNSIPERQKERYATVLDEYLDFADHYPNSKLKPDAEKFYTLAQNNIKSLDNEQIKAKSNQ